MRSIVVVSTLILPAASPLFSQSVPNRTVPIFSVTVVQRSLKAVNFQHRSGPTRIDVKGTVLLPKADGDARVEVKNGYTQIDAVLRHIDPPTLFGGEYLTYVLWAITPDGKPVNLGEVISDPSNKAKMRVTCPYSTFGLLVTAEPYFSVPYPSDVVVMESMVRPDTVGRVEDVVAKVDLLPRGQYTLHIQAQELASARMNQEPKVSMPEYEELLTLYQARNAVQIARADGAAEFAADTLGKAQRLLDEAESQRSHKAPFSTVTTTARQAVQAASDARAITMQKKAPPQNP